MDTNFKDLLAEWNKIENALPFSPDSLEYQHAWGEEREAFYKNNGHIPCSQNDIERIRTLKGAFKGERIFVIGNGPSLNITPLDKLDNEFTFMVNRGYLLYDRIKWRPRFYTATDWRVVPDIAHEINLLTGTICFFEERFRGLLREGDDVYWYTHTPATLPTEKRFAYNIELGVRGAGSVIGTAIQIAFYLGFSPIYLIGCDLGYYVNKTVIQEGTDIFGTGTKLFLTSTEDDDTNHFEKRYFGAGRRWHDPNVNRMISGHKQCLDGVEAKNGNILNATIGGELEVYPRVKFESLFPKEYTCNKFDLFNSILNTLSEINPIPFSRTNLVGPYLRCENINLDETDIVYSIIINMAEEPGVMIDVGAHRGNSCLNFLKLGWKIFAFEPDENNRSVLMKRTKEIKFANRMAIDQRAVGVRCENNVPYFTSEQSSGISGLLPFHPSHTQTGHVDVITLSDYLKDKDLDTIEFLKVDTEGNDLFVLKGFPWDKFHPDIIVCEFEDQKTQHLGYTWKDMCKYLLDRGYSIYVSEWHPILRYGIRHNWHGLKCYPCELEDPKAWGNLLAFKDDPGATIVKEYFKESLRINTSDKSKGSLIKSKVKKIKDTADHKVTKLKNSHESLKVFMKKFHNITSRFLRIVNISSYVRFAEWIRNKNETLFRIGQFSMWTLRYYNRHPKVLAFEIFIVMTLNLTYIANPHYIKYRGYLILASCIILLLSFLFLSLSFVNEKFLNFVKKVQQNRILQSSEIIIELKKTREQLSVRINEQKIMLNRLTETVEENRENEHKNKEYIKKMRKELENIIYGIDKNARKDLEGIRETINGIQDISQQALEESQKAIKSNLDTINAEKKTRKEIEGIRETINAIQDISHQALEESQNINISHVDMINKANFLNSMIYQHFNRHLHNKHIEKLLKTWCPALGLERMNKKALGYLGHRICQIENNCSGRLATNLEDALLRVLISQSIKGKKLEILEIGSLFGVSLAVIYDNCRGYFDEIHLTALDPLEGYYEENTYDITTKMPVKKTIFEHNMRIMDIPKEDVTLIEYLSTNIEAKKAAAKRTYDVLLIDGDHSYDGVKFDFDNYHPFIKQGGYIIFDDYKATEWPGVTEFIDKELKLKESLQMIGNEWRTAVFKIQ